jgi:hypothetical protein
MGTQGPSPYANGDGLALAWDGHQVGLTAGGAIVALAGRELDDVVAWLTEARQARDGTSMLHPLQRAGEVTPTPAEQ